MHRITMGKADVNSLFVYYAWNEKSYPADSFRMPFVSNHDKNAWEGTEFEQFGAGLEAAVVLSVVGEGMPLIYNGQESGSPKRLEFFEKDVIEWREHSQGALYQQLFALKKRCTALWNGAWSATMIQVLNSCQSQVFSFVRQNAQDKVFVVINFSSTAQTVTFAEQLYYGQYTEFWSREAVVLDHATQLELTPWGYLVFIG